MISTLNTGARYFSLVLLCTGPFIGLNVSTALFPSPRCFKKYRGTHDDLQIQISWETTVVPRPRAKRAALIAIANCVSSVSHWFTPYLFLRSQEPRYQTGGGVIIAGCGLTVLFCLGTRWWCGRKNKALDEADGVSGNGTGWRYAT